jgi:hypothetical protein
MKSSKENSKTKKGSNVPKLAESKIIVENTPTYTHEEISQKASELYLQRIERGEQGSAEQDWINAEKALEESEG